MKEHTLAVQNEIADVKLSDKDENYLQDKFGECAKVLQWNGKEPTYYIHAGTKILKHSDTRSLFNLLATEYKKNKFLSIW